MKIKIKYLPGANKLKKIPQGNWIDLHSYESISYDTNEEHKISLGFAMELPEGYEAEVKPRSSTFKNFGAVQTNSVACIDNSYSGDNDIWFWPFFSLKPGVIKKGDRVCQMRIRKKQPDLEFEEVDSLGNKNRGGYGSTGVN